MVHILKKTVVLVSMFAIALGVFGSFAGLAQARASFVNTTMTDGVVGQAYSFQFQASQGSPPYSYEKWYTTYPANDVTLSSEGLISGTPTVAGNWEWGIRLSDTINSVYGIFQWKVSASGATTAPTLTTSLDTTNPAAATVSPGAADVPFASFKLRATGSAVSISAIKIQTDSSSGSGINTVKVASSGSALGPVTSLSTPDSNGIRSATVTLTSPLTIDKDTHKVIDVSATLASSVTGTLRLGLGGMTFVTSPAPALSGGLPLYGNTMTVAGTTSGVTLTVSTPNTAPSGTLPATVDNYEFSSIKLQATGGAVNLTGLRIVSDSSIASAVTSVKLYKNNAELIGVATTLSYTDGGIKYTPIVFSSPLVIPSGGFITLDVTASLTNSAAGTIRLGISNFQFSGTPPTVSGTVPVYGNAFTVAGSTAVSQVAITRDTVYPSTITVTPAQSNVTLFGFKVLASQADAQLTAVYVGVDTASEFAKLTNWKLLYGSSTITGVGPVSVGTNPNAVQFILPSPLVLQKNVSQSLRVTATIATGVSGVVQPKLLSAIIKDASGNQLTSGVTIESIATQVTIGTTTTPNTLQVTSPTVLPEGVVGQPYSYKFAATGGTAPYTWTLAPRAFNGYRCCLLNLSSDGTFASNPASDGKHMPDSGSYEIAVKVSDSAGRSAEKLMTYVVRPAGVTTGAKEGFVDFVSGSQTSGWAFDSNTLPKVTFVFENTATTQRFTLDTYPSTATPRPDVVSYLASKYGLSVTVPVGFTLNPGSVITTNGTYRIVSATYNGKELTTNATAQNRFTIGGPDINPTQYANQYVRVDGDSTVYYVVGWGGKMPILSAQVFLSYSGKWENIITIPQEVLDDMDDVMYIKQRGNARVYKIENGVKYYLTPQAASRLAVDPARVVEVNKTEFVSYRTGKSIQ